MERKLKVGVIGLGGRGYGLLTTVDRMEDIEVIGVCDLYEDRVEKGKKDVFEVTGKTPFGSQDFVDILNLEGLEAVLVTTSWADHIHIAIQAMKRGIYVACEAGGSYSIDECFELVKCYEETRIPCMLLENCCYGREELMVLNMVNKGILGEIVHCQGGYQHDLRYEISNGRENRHYRLKNYMYRNCDNYPTHDLGPIAKILNINRGNRMLSLTSIASKARGLNEYNKQQKGSEYDLTNYHFSQGDIVTTMIKCANGETITLILDTTLPRFYSRAFRVQGTKGMYMEDNQSIFIDGIHNKHEAFWREEWGNVDKYRAEYDHPIWDGYDGEGGHGGMDFLVLYAFFDSVRKKVQTPIDVYDMASWMCISALTEISIANGGQPIDIPDFTNGKWLKNEFKPLGKYFI